MSSTWIEYKGKKILFTDFKGQDQSEMMETLKGQIDIYKTSHGKLLVLDDLTDTRINQEFMDLAKAAEKANGQRLEIINAVLGITGIKKVFLNTFNLIAKNKVAPFNNKEDAMEYLIKQ